MKILAIRGKDLASLAGDFCLDFRQEPLASTGLFALSGPTGSGKSTLLDALCLALFNNTPRLRQANQRVSIIDVGEHQLAQNDTSNLLRRGCASAYAEVDFQGNDQRHYRARWQISRARGRTQGKLQGVKMSLHALSSPPYANGQPEELAAIGDKKTSVLAEISHRLGLSFDQFTRAVLLAQNEFSAFLKTTDDDRATLLEALTGSGLYSSISRLAFDRHKQEKQQLDQLAAQLGLDSAMPTDEREQAEQRLQQQQQQALDLACEQQLIHNALAWHAALTTLQASIDQQQQQCQQLQQQNVEQAPARRRQQAANQADKARPLIHQLDRLQQTQQQTASQLAQLRSAHGSLDAQQQQAQHHNRASQAQAEATQQAITAAQPELKQARMLDTELQWRQTEQALHQQQCQQQQASLQQAQRELSHCEQQLAGQREQLAISQSWLEAHQDQAILANQWPRWQPMLQQVGERQAQLLDRQQRLAQQRTQLNNDQQAQQQLQQDVAKLEEQLAASQARRDTLRLQLSDPDNDPGRRHQQHLQLQEQLSQLQACHTQWQDLTAAQEQLGEDQQALAELTAQQAPLIERCQAAEAELQAQHQDWQDAQTALRLASLANAENVIQLRAQLHDAQPCPVCGSPEHPYAQEQDQAIRQLFSTLSRQAEALDQARQQQLRAVTTLRTQTQLLDEQLPNAQRAWQLSEHRLTQLRQLWQQNPAAEAWRALAPDQLSTAFAQQQAQWQQQLAAHEQQQSQWLDQQRQITQADQQWQAANEQLQPLQQALQRAATELSQQQRQLELDSERVNDTRALLTEGLQALDQAFADPNWRQTWQANPDQFAQHCLQWVDDWQRQLLQQQQRQQAVDDLRSQQVVFNERLVAKQAEQQRLMAVRQQKDQQVRQLQDARAALLLGQPADAFEQQLQQKLLQQQQAVRLAQDALLVADQELRDADRQAQQLAETEQQLQAEWQGARQQLTTWLAAQDASLGLHHEQEVRQLLAWDEQQREQTQLQLQALQQQLLEHQAVLADQQQRRQAHLQQQPAGDEVEWQARLQTHQTQTQALQDAQSELKLRLQDDDRKRHQAQQTQIAFEQQQVRVRLWGQLNDLIGSADGKKFRNYAQQLTLDILLNDSNQQLSSLSRRYGLQRIPDSLSLQVIDHDMGDEVRSVYSLSGGESFLVSLALALGLASLSANRVPVETLFIDEGFGSLDSDTLQVAMAALDSLQAQGRKVGVITHVQEMTERIEVKVLVTKNAQGASSVHVVS